MNSDCNNGQGKVWKNFKINNKDYMICFVKENESWKVLLTNLIEIWSETLTDESVFHKCQTMNPLLNLEVFDWKEVVLDMLNNIPEYMHENRLEVTTYHLELQKKKGFIKLRFLLDLLKGTPQQFWKSVTMPLCSSSMELIRRYKILLDLVKQKDEEIAEYKAEGAELIRNYIATKPFSEELFRTDDTGSTDFVNIFQSVLCFYNEITLLKSHAKLEVSSNDASGTNASKTDGNVFLDSSKNDFVQKLRQDKLNNIQGPSKVEECTANSSSKASILKISSTSHTIPKKKNKKTLNDFIKFMLFVLLCDMCYIC
ncbi:PREDICTED: non-homologous end-joining factor 1-like isoform X1 [Cyphomyrmex costatus]|uniref:non-homologous end-joining factor 1-like isoform X1 n=1 Tax=Cyphomyrmex costatus TaxID=456900 RepID=UPI0008523AD2|nr:PREDICTED: non-homologous end-joining factor 1-like isoform X1 [Cyphomyrmex costatus]